jgi:hypothetical protein
MLISAAGTMQAIAGARQVTNSKIRAPSWRKARTAKNVITSFTPTCLTTNQFLFPSGMSGLGSGMKPLRLGIFTSGSVFCVRSAFPSTIPFI